MTVLALAQALFMSIQGMAAAANPLAGYMLLGADEKWLATVPIFLMQLGIMSATIPASLLMGVIGRRAGFVIGALLGVVGGSIGCLALYRHSFSCSAWRRCARACRRRSSGISGWPRPTLRSPPTAPGQFRW